MWSECLCDVGGGGVGAVLSFLFSFLFSRVRVMERKLVSNDFSPL
jgi:hypothetical protein